MTVFLLQTTAKYSVVYFKLFSRQQLMSGPKANFRLTSNLEKIGKKLKIQIFLFAISFFSGILLSNAQWKFANGTAEFSIKNAGFKVNGHFEKLNATVIFNPEKLESTQIEASVDVESIETGIQLRNKHLKKEEYFNAAQFPKIQLKLIRLAKNGLVWNGNFEVTIKGTIKTISIPIKFNPSGNKAILHSNFTLNRLDFKIGGSSWTMSDEVNIQLTANLIQP